MEHARRAAAPALVPFRAHRHHHHCRVLSLLLLVLLVLLLLLELLLLRPPPPPSPRFLARRWRVFRRWELFLPRLVETTERRTGTSGRPATAPVARRLRYRWNRGLFVASPLRRADRPGGGRCPSAFSLRIQPNLVTVGHAAAEKVQLSSRHSLRSAPLSSSLPSSPPLFYLSLYFSTVAPIPSFSFRLCVSLDPSLLHPLSRKHAVSLSPSLSPSPLV